MHCEVKHHNECPEDLLGKKVFSWRMPCLPHDSCLWACRKQAVGSAYKSSHLLLQVWADVFTSVTFTELPCLLHASELQLFLSDFLHYMDTIYSSSTASWHLHDNYENQILTFRKSTLYSSYCYCDFIDQNLVMLSERNCSLWCMDWLA